VLYLPWRADLFSFGPKLMGPLASNNLFAMFMFVLLGASLFYFARKKLN
jgi:LPXTG-motif cell wall-anchored protein